MNFFKTNFSTAFLGKVNMRDGQVAMLTGTVALALLAGALAFQYLGHLAPCEMCHWQRWPHIGAAIVGICGIQMFKKETRSLAAIAVLLVATSGLIGAYQQGMQWHLLPGPTACTGQRYVIGSNIVPVVQCDVVTWQLFGLSLAGYNAIISLATAAIGTSLLVKNRK